MNTHPRASVTRAAVLATCLLAVSTGCGSTSAVPSDRTTDRRGPTTSITLGASTPLGAGTVAAYVVVDERHDVSALGVRIDDAAVARPPAGTTPTVLMLALPERLNTAPFTAVMFDWNPRGHAPTALFGAPHFDVHFEMVDPGELTAIRPSDPRYAERAAHLPESRYLPAHYGPLPGPPVSAQSVPGMGVHLADATRPLIPGRYRFDNILLAGSWDGDLTYLEPMMTREWLQQRPITDQPIPPSSAVARGGLYPSRYTVRHDGDDGSFRIELSGLRHRLPD